jgi:hypothetical protein
MITQQQVTKFLKHARKIGSSRLIALCLSAAEAIEMYGARAADVPAVKAISRELPFQMAGERGHVAARQNASLECTRCGSSGSVADTEKGIKLTGAIFTARCGVAP